VRDAIFQNRWGRDVVGALTTQVLCQFLQVWNLLRLVVLEPLQADRFVWKWSPDSKYSASSTYRAFFAGSTNLLGAKELWRTKAPLRVKLFFWLALHRRLWMANRRMRHRLQDGDACALCDQASETCGHLFLGCAFGRELWFKLLAPVGLATLVPEHDDNLGAWWLRQRRRLDRNNRPPFDSLMLIIAWCLWKERNARTFRQTSRNARDIFKVVVAKAEDWV
jgi:hypothetical protein